MQLENTINLKDYTLLEKIGTGSFGEVYKVRENETGNIYAAKISSKPLEDNSSEALLDLSREVNIISKIKHPSILGFIGFSPFDFNNDPRPVIITEYIRNGSLYDIITLERKSLKLEEWNDTRKVINIYGIASAMSYLHSHKIIHRDLKPLNILIDDCIRKKNLL